MSCLSVCLVSLISTITGMHSIAVIMLMIHCRETCNENICIYAVFHMSDVFLCVNFVFLVQVFFALNRKPETLYCATFCRSFSNLCC